MYWSACGTGTPAWALSLEPGLCLGLGFCPVPGIIFHLPCRGQAGSRPTLRAGGPLLDGIPEHRGWGCPWIPLAVFPSVCVNTPLSLVPWPRFLHLLPTPSPSGSLPPASAPLCPLQRQQTGLAGAQPRPAAIPTSSPSSASPQGLTAASSRFGKLGPGLGDTRGLSRAMEHFTCARHCAMHFIYSIVSASLLQIVRQVFFWSPFNR